MNFGTTIFISAEPEVTWIEDIIFEVVKKLPSELFGELHSWDSIITQFPLIHKFDLKTAQKLTTQVTSERVISPEPLFPLDARESEENFREFLERKPIRVMLIGDVNPLFYEIGDLLAKQFRTYQISPQQLINHQIIRRSQIGKWLYWNLKEERGIPIWVVFKLLEHELKRDKYIHRGFILTGFPIFPEFNTTIGIACTFNEEEDYALEHAYLDNDSVDKLLEEDYTTDDETESISHCSTSSSIFSNFDNQEELLNEIRNKEFIQFDMSEDIVLRNCVQRQLDVIYDLWCRPDVLVYLDSYYYSNHYITSRDIIQKFVLFYYKENIIQVDCRIGLKNLINNICNRFKYKNVKINYDCVCVNTHGNSAMSIEELCGTGNVLPNYKWWVSQFGSVCPVSLYYGRRRFCNSKFAVRYLRYMFLCYTSKDRKAFVANPRKYLTLLPPCRVAVIGPHRIGKTTLSKYLARYFKADIYQSHIDKSSESITKLNKKDFKDKALKKELKDLETLRLQDYTALKQRKIEEWTACVMAVMNDIITRSLNKGKKKGQRFDAFSNKQAEKYFQAAFSRTIPDTGIKKLLLDNAIFNKGIQSISSNDFLDWVSVKPKSRHLYRQYVIDSAPLNITFWEELLNYDELPDCVFFLKTASINKIFDIYSLTHCENCINDKVIFERICRKFKGWKNYLDHKSEEKPTHGMPMDKFTYQYLKHLVAARYKESFDLIEKYGELQYFFQEHDVICIDVDISKRTWTETILKALTDYLSMYVHKATPLYNVYLQGSVDAGEREYEIEEHVGSITSSWYNETIEKDKSTESETFTSTLNNYGSFLDWCPVNLKKNNVLIKGDMHYAAKYKNKVYVMHSNEAFQEFVADPSTFSQVIPVAPPPRIFLTGLNHRNKTKFAESLATSLSVQKSSYMQHLTTMPYNAFLRDDFSIETVKEHYRKIKHEFLKDLKATYEKGTVIFGFPMFLEQFNDAAALNMYPECLFIFDDLEEVMQSMYRYFARMHMMQYITTRTSILINAHRRPSSFESRSPSITSDIGALPETIKHNIKQKCNLLIQPFLLELDKIEDACLKLRIPVIKVPKHFKRAGILDYYVNQINHGRERAAIFEDVQLISMEESKILLQSGYYRFSRFNRSCPVDVGKLITLNYFEGMRRQGRIFPCIYRDFIYFISGHKNLKIFKKNPITCADSCNPPQLTDPLRIAVFGAPKSGISTICQAASQGLAFKIIARDDFTQEPISESDVINMLKLNRSVSSNGIIFDNIPLTPTLLYDAALSGLSITVVIIVVTSFKKILETWYIQNQNIKNCPSLLLPELLQKYCETQNSIRCIRNSYLTSLFNIMYVDGDTNSWSTWDVTKHAIIKTGRCISGYRAKILRNRCANLSQLNLFNDAKLFKREINHFYCQVCLDLGKLNAFKYYYVNVRPEFYSRECQKLLNRPYGYLNDEIYKKFNFDDPFVFNDLAPPLGSQKRNLMCMLQYRDVFYWTCYDHTINFMTYTNQYYKDSDKLKPLYVPFLVMGYTKDFVAFNGFCPVKYAQGKLIKGVMNLSVYYRKKVYLMSSKENTLEFLSYPEKYYKLKFDPCMGLHEQETITFYGLSEEKISSTILDLSNTRPKHFALDGTESAATFMALKFKVNNPNELNVEYWRIALRTFLNQCKMLDEEIKKSEENHVGYQFRMRDLIFFVNTINQSGNKVPAYLNVVDIAGLVKGAAEGQGLGNAFLSHISACDAIFHLCRAFEDPDVTHVEGEVDPVRDLDIISEELRLKDEEKLNQNLDKLEKVVARGGDKKLKPEYDSLLKVKTILVDEKKHLRFADWNAHDIETLNKYMFLTSKPVIYLVNLSDKDFIRKKNKWLAKIKEWIDKNDPGATIIPFSGHFEHDLAEKDESERKAYEDETKCKSVLDKIIVTGYKALQLEYFFTAGPDEVKAWTIQKGTKAPQAAGRIHTDFEKGFIMAEVMHFKDFKEEGSEAAAKSAGKYRQQGRNYVVEDGDIIFFKFNAGAGLKDAKKK